MIAPSHNREKIASYDMPTDLEPDQSTSRWSEHVVAYEAVFEPFTLGLTSPAFGRLGLAPGARVLDVAAGPGGAALALARAGCRVTAIDGAAAMVDRIAARAVEAGLAVDAAVMDAASLDFPDATFDATISAFGVVLVPDAAGALAEMRRVVRQGGRVAVVTWTEPQRYELSALLSASADEVWPERPRPPLPAQLRYRERPALEELFGAAGLTKPDIETVEAYLEAPSAEWLIERLAFAPGMETMLAALGPRRAAVCEAALCKLRARFDSGPIKLGGVAFAAVAIVS